MKIAGFVAGEFTMGVATKRTPPSPGRATRWLGEGQHRDRSNIVGVRVAVSVSGPAWDLR
jgi:hypothetical protein